MQVFVNKQGKSPY